MKKVTWPDKNEVMNTTVVVIVTSFFFGLFLFAVDVAIEYGVTFVRNRF
ncbi:MAG: preprotein translocase subunit SecE [Acidobacteria bacterium]|nr:preprotein translocase subunit SecE [Acidobacteriota bacterium]